jgi:trimeric autotransporter adhesin
VKKTNSILPLVLGILLSPLFAQAQVMVTLAGNGSAGFAGDGGLSTAATLNAPYGVALDDTGNLYICDVGNHRIRKVRPAYGGNITTIAGYGTVGYSGDGGPAIYARFNGMNDMAIDHNGNIYIADGGNNRIRKINRGDTITTVAGTGIGGYNGDGIQATDAQLNVPRQVAVDDTGNVYVADEHNNRIRKIDTAGIITTIAGTGTPGYSPDGSAADTSKLSNLQLIKIDSKNNIFFADNLRIRRIDALTGIMTTVAGNGTGGFSGDGGPATAAQINSSAIAIDTSGNLYMAEGGPDRIRKVNTSGVISTIAGNGTGGYAGDGGDPLEAKLLFPQGVAVNNAGDIFIGDVGNNRVRMVTTQLDGVGLPPKSDPLVITIFPNPAKGNFTLQVNAVATLGNIVVVMSDVNGKETDRLTIPANKQVSVATCCAPGVYTVSASCGNEHYTEKLIIE